MFSDVDVMVVELVNKRKNFCSDGGFFDGIYGGEGVNGSFIF